MGILHKEAPVADATVNCPECSALDWVLRTPRLLGGGEESILCRACGYDAGPPFPDPGEDDETEKAESLAAGRDALARATFPVYAPAGLPWAPTGWYLTAADIPSGVPVQSVTLACEDPWVSVTTERVEFAGDRDEGLRGTLADTLYGDELPRAGRSDAAYALEVHRREATIEAQVAALLPSEATLRIDGRDVPCTLLAAGRAWAAVAAIGPIAVFAGSDSVPFGDVRLELVQADHGA